MAGNFDKFGFEINASGNAVNVLDNIVKSLEKIKIASKEIKPGGHNVNIKEDFMRRGKLLPGEYHRAVLSGQRMVYKQAQKNVQMSTMLSDAHYKEILTERILLKEQNKKITNNIKEELGLKKTTAATKDKTNSNNNLKKSYSGLALKMGTVLMLARRVGLFTAHAIQESGAYVENLNLFAVTFGKNYQETAQWALDLAHNFGLASNEVIKFTGLFKQLSTAIGIVGETGTQMSTTLTSLGYDLASFFNISVTSAMQKLQAGIFSGQTKPLRSIGIDVTYQSIDNLLKTNEALAQFGTSSKKLDQSQKAIARMILVMQAANNSFGDMANTINTLANQIRIFKGATQEFKLAFGDYIQEPVNKALIYLNGLLIAATDIMRAFKPLTTKSATGDSQIKTMGDDAEESSEQIDELTGKLTGFDKFNVLGGQTPGGGASGITDALQKEFEKQQEIYKKRLEEMEKVSNKAREMAAKIKNWFIYDTGLKDENGNPFYQWTEKGKAFITVLKAIATAGAAGILIKISSSIIKIKDSALGLFKVFGLLANHPVIAIMTAVSAVLIHLYRNNEEFRESVQQLCSAIAPLFNTVFKMLNEVIVPLINLITPVVTTILAPILTILTKITTKIVEMYTFALAPSMYVLEFISKVLETILVTATKLVSFDWGISSFNEAMSEIWTKWNTSELMGKTAGNFVKGFAGGGITNANLIMTHENGTREWVGKQGSSTAVVNDTQMSDVMRQAVAQGTYQALMSMQENNGGAMEQPINLYIDGDKVFNATRKVAKRQGLDFSRV